MPTTKAKFQIVGEDRTKQAFQSVNRNLGGLKNALAGLGIGAAIAGLIRANKSALAFADSIEKAGQVAGLSSESLQKLRFAGEQVGLSTKDVDEGFRRFNRRLGEFVNSGGGPAAKALETLGLTLDDVKGKAPGDIFEQVTRGLLKFENQSQRAALEAQLFGDDAGPKMDLLVRQGVNVIRELGEEAKRTGAILSNETVQKAARATEEFDKMAAVIKGNVTTAFVNLSPPIIAVTSVIADATAGFAAFFNLFDKPEVDGSLDGLRDKLFRLTDEAVELRAKMAETPQDSVFFAGLQRRLEEVNILINETNQGMLDLQKGGGGESKKPTATTPPAAITNLGNITTLPTLPLADMTGPMSDYNKLLEEGARLTEDLRTPTEQYYDQVSRYTDLLNKNIITQETFTRAVNTSWAEVGGEAKESLDDISEFTRSAFERMQGATSDLFFNVLQGNFKDMGKRFKATLDSMVADLFASRLFNAVAGLAGTGAGTFGGFVGALLGPGKATGGPVSPGIIYPVNEIEPEFFRPNVGGQVIPLSKMPAANDRAGTTVHVSMVVNAKDVASFRQSEHQIAADLGMKIQMAMGRF